MGAMKISFFQTVPKNWPKNPKGKDYNKDSKKYLFGIHRYCLTVIISSASITIDPLGILNGSYP